MSQTQAQLVKGFSNTSASADVITVDSSANVGINKTSPVKDLDVTGEIRASTGMLFGTDTAAANTLDDYEEGDWTPVFAGATTAGSYTYTSQVGKYTKIGNTVTAHAFLENITTGSAGSGAIRIKGLPFTSANDASGNVFPHGVIRLVEFDVQTGAYDMNCAVLSGNTELSVIVCRDALAAVSVQSTGKVNNTADIFLTVSYRAA